MRTNVPDAKVQAPVCRASPTPPRTSVGRLCPLKQPGHSEHHVGPNSEVDLRSPDAGTADLRLSRSQKGPGRGCRKPASPRDLLRGEQNRHLPRRLRLLESSSVTCLWASAPSHLHLRKASHAPARPFTATLLQASATAPPGFCGLFAVATRHADALSSAWQLQGHCPSLSHSCIHSTNIREHFLCGRHCSKRERRSDENKLEALTS